MNDEIEEYICPRCGNSNETCRCDDYEDDFLGYDINEYLEDMPTFETCAHCSYCKQINNNDKYNSYPVFICQNLNKGSIIYYDTENTDYPSKTEGCEYFEYFRV